MSEEEMKVVDYWKNYMEILHWNTQLVSEHHMKVLLDLIEKQSKEIEELKEKNEYLPNWVSKKYVSKDKIKAFIKEELPDDEICSCCKIFDVNGVELKRKLQSLLEEEE